MSLPLKVAQCLNCPHMHFDAWQHQRFCETGNKISLQCELGCPHDLHNNPPICIPPPIELRGFFKPEIVAQRAAWRSIHLYPATLPDNFDRAEVMRWLSYLPVNLPTGCACRKNWPQLLAMIGDSDLSTKTALHRALVRIHNAKNRELGKAEISDARAARVYGITHLLPAEEIAADQSGPISVAVNATWGLGDAICLTAALRDIHATYPGEFDFFIQTERPDVFRGLPAVRLLSPADKPDTCLTIHGSHPSPDGNGEHIIEFFRRRMASIINRPITAGQKIPWLAKPEEGSSPIDGAYWVIAPGWRSEISVKAWPVDRWQAVIDALVAKGVNTVRIGASSSCDFQLPLRGVTLDLVGKTTIAEMFRLIAHPNCIGTIGLESSHAHISRAFSKRAIVLAGSRIPSQTVRYGVPEETWLGDDALPCAGCDAHYSAPRDVKDRRACLMPRADGYATCMGLITPEQVVAAVTGEPSPAYAGPLRVGLCSFYTPNISSWAEPAARRMREYCDRHGYFYAPFDPANPPAPNRKPMWQKPDMISPHLPDLDLMAWVDADCVIVRPDFRIESILTYGEADLYLANDCNGMNAGVMIWRNTPAAFELLVRWKKSGDAEHVARIRNSDQDELGKCIAQMGDKIKVVHLQKPLINAYDMTHAEPGDENPGWLIHCVSEENKLARMNHWLYPT